MKQDLKEAVEGKDSNADILGFAGNKGRDGGMTSRSMGKGGEKKGIYLADDSKGSEDLINFLEGKLE